MKFWGKVSFWCGMLFALLGRVSLVLAQVPGRDIFTPEKILGAKNIDYIKILNTGLTILLTVAGFTAVGFTVYSGILYITSSGDPAKVNRALQSGIYSLVGTIIIALSLFILRSIAGSAGLFATGG